MLTIDQLQPGTYYIPVFARIERTGSTFAELYRTDAPFYRYLGNSQFTTEDGTPVATFYDPELGLAVATDAPDGFIQ